MPADWIAGYWGKSGGQDWHPLAYHALDVAAVGQCLTRPGQPFRGLFERHAAGLADLVPFLLALHDLGKMAPAFQVQVPDLAARLGRVQAPAPGTPRHHHTVLGQMLWERHMQRRAEDLLPGLDPYALESLAPAVLAHHGQPVSPPDESRLTLEEAFPFPSLADADSFVSTCAALLAPAILPALDEDRAAVASWVLAGFAVLCDWVGSNAAWFPSRTADLSLDAYWTGEALPRASGAVARAGLGGAQPAAEGGLVELFGLHRPSNLQRLAEAVPLGGGPGLFVLEDLTGSGKTEAALVLARRLMAAGRADGIFIGLPTQATANAMFGRLGQSYRRLFAPGLDPSLVLAHGGAAMHPGFREAVVLPEARPDRAGHETDTAGARAAAWLADNRKKALLAEVGVGTLDQALLGVLPTRHQGLRLLGLGRSLLVADEVHAYDVYTGELLQTLLAFQAALGGSAVLLSATLADGQRRALVDAFRRGRGQEPTPAGDASPAAYPLLTRWAEGEAEPAEFAVDSAPGAEPPPVHPFQAHRLAPAEAVARVLALAAEGHCVCWVRNTVQDARDAWAELSAHLPADRLHLFHARFAPADRQRVEGQVLDLFGKDSGPEQRRGRVLVATQVVEQSLDLDFDAMLSDLAPVDLLLQRAGRLHRHGHRGDRGRPVLEVVGPESVPDPPEDWYAGPFPRAAYVYPDHGRLWLTQRLLTGPDAPPGPLDLRRESRRLIEAVFGPDAEVPGSLWEAHDRMQGQRMADRYLAASNALPLMSGYGGEVSLHGWESDTEVATRMGEPRTTLLLALRDEAGALLPWSLREVGVLPDGDSLALRRAWAESEVDVPRRHADGPAAAADPERVRALAPLAERLHLGRGRNRSLVILDPPAETGAPWTGLATREGQPVAVFYDPTTGLSLGAAGSTE